MDEQGHPHIDKAKVKAEERLDGKYLIRTSDDTLSPVDVALGYKQLYQVENAFRTLKTTLELRPVYHRIEDRIRSHILLCWPALLLVRVMENQTGQTWTPLFALGTFPVSFPASPQSLFALLMQVPELPSAPSVWDTWWTG
jgi:hypothetical protein